MEVLFNSNLHTPAFKGMKEDKELTEAYGNFRNLAIALYPSKSAEDGYKFKEAVDVLEHAVDEFVNCPDPSEDSSYLADEYKAPIKKYFNHITFNKAEIWADYIEPMSEKIKSMRKKLGDFLVRQESLEKANLQPEETYKTQSGSELEVYNPQGDELVAYNFACNLFREKPYFADDINFKDGVLYEERADQLIKKGYFAQASDVLINELVRHKNEVVKLSSPKENILLDISRVLQKLGGVYAQLKDFEKADEVFGNARVIAMKLNSQKHIKEAMTAQSDFYLDAINETEGDKKSLYIEKLRKLSNLQNKFFPAK